MNNKISIAEITAMLVTIIVGFGAITFVGDFVRINEREVGVITRLGKVTRTVGAGWHYKTPFVSSHSATYDISTQTLSAGMEGTSKDQQAVSFEINVLYRLDSSKIEDIYKTVGGNGNGGAFPDTRIADYITPIVQDTVKSVSAEFTATEQLSQREQLGVRISEQLRERLTQYHVIVDTINITNISFSTEFNQAIERKVVAQQLAEQKKFELEAEKNQLEVEKVKAETVEIQGQALRANPEVLEQQKIEKWNGVLPQVQGNNDVIIDLNK